MTHETAQRLASLLTEERIRQHLSIRQLVERSGVPRSTISRIEKAGVTQIPPDTLRRLAEALSLEVADLYSTVGYVQPTTLPTFTPYLRAKYGDIPADALAELQQSFEVIARRHGYDADGPAPGEDDRAVTDQT